MDRKGKLADNFSIFNNKAETIIISEENSSSHTKQKHEAINWDLTSNIADQIATVLYKNNINSVIIEGGAKTLQTFIDENLWDEARVFSGQVQFKNGVQAPIFSGRLISNENILTDTLKIYKND